MPSNADTRTSPAGPETANADETEDEAAEVRLAAALATDLDTGFAELVRRYERLVYSVTLRSTNRRADAEDLAADALLRAYRALRGYDPTRIAALRPRPWLLTIVRNTARNAAREATRRPGPPPTFDAGGGAGEPRAGGPTVEQHVEADETQRRLGELLGELTETQRSAVVLRHVVGLPTSEVAQVLGCPEGTAKSHISRGLHRLRELLATANTTHTSEGMDR